MTNSEEKYGKKIDYDPLWKGPMDNIRTPTDRIWLIIFTLFVLVYISSAMYGLCQGDLETLTAPYDYAGRICGYDKDVQKKPYLLFLDLKDCIGSDGYCDTLTPSVCVSQCPTENFIYNRNSSTDSLEKIKEKLICTADTDVGSISSFDHLDILMSHKKCAKWYLISEPVYKRCLAFNAWVGHENQTITSDELFKARTAIRDQELLLNKMASSIRASMGPSAVAIICGGIFALSYVILLKWLAVPFFYASIGMFCSFLGYGIYVACVSYVKTRKGQSLFALILMILLIVAVIIAVIHFRKKIYLACQLVKESSKSVMHLSVTLIFPILPWLLYLLITVFSVLVIMSLYTIVTPNYAIEQLSNETEEECRCAETADMKLYNGAPCNPIIFNDNCKANGQPCQFLQCRLMSKTNPKYLYIFQSINFVGFYWLIFFVSGFNYMVLGGAFASWYWTFNKNNIGNRAVINSISRTTRYHMGSIALGSLVLTISQMIRLLFQGLHTKLRETNSGILASCMCCFRYLFDILDSLLNFLSYNAYIMGAIHGKSFCQSAKSAYHLIMRNVVKVFVVNTVADWLFTMAKLLVTSLAVAGVSLYYNYNEAKDPDEIDVALIVTALGTFIIASVFFSVQSVAVNTIFLCFIEDSERNDGTEDRPYYMNDKLKQLLYK